MTETLRPPSRIPLILALLYLVPALLLFAFLMICFTGGGRCPGPVIASFPFTPVLRWLEWPWESMVPAGLFTGPVWGRVLILSSIGLNTGAIFGGAKLCQGIVRASRQNHRTWATNVFSSFSAQKERFFYQQSKVAVVLVSLYLVFGLVLWLKWQVCSGWTFLCSAPLLEYMARPWGIWFGWDVIANSNVSVAESLGLLGARLFVLAALVLNAGVLFCLVKLYQWIFGRLRHNLPRLVGATVALTYAILALFTYLAAMHCVGFLCDLGVMLLLVPWTIQSTFHFRGGAVLFLFSVNSLLLYAVFAGLTWLVLFISSPSARRRA